MPEELITPNSKVELLIYNDTFKVHVFKVRSDNAQDNINNQVVEILNNIRNMPSFKFIVMDETNVVNVSTMDPNKKFKAVAEFLRSPEGRHLRNNCPILWVIIWEYNEKLCELIIKLGVIEEITLKLNDPTLSPRERLQWKELLKKTPIYIENLKVRIQQLEEQITQEQQNNPQCHTLLEPLESLFTEFPRGPQEELKDLLRQNIEDMNKLRETMRQMMERLGNQG